MIFEADSEITVVIIDDHALVRDGTRRILEEDSRIKVVATCESAEEGLSVIEELHPQIALVDIHLPGMSGIEMTRRISDEHAQTRVIVLTAFGDASYARAAMAAGAQLFIEKTAPSETVIGAIISTASLDPLALNTFASDTAKAGPTGSTDPGSTSQPNTPPSAGSHKDSFAPTLTDREIEVVSLLAKGLSNKAIAQKLGISRRTVEGHVSRVLAKADVTSRTELFRFALQHNWISI